MIKDAASLELLAKTKVLAFDKTGTLTEGRPKVTDVASAEGGKLSADDIAVIYGLEERSEHPLAGALVAWASLSDARAVVPEQFTYHPGMGICGRIGSDEWWAGSMRMAENNCGAIPASIRDRLDVWSDEGSGIVMFGKNSELKAAFRISDTLKSEAKSVVGQLKKLGIRPVLLTGDSAKVADAIAREVGIDDVYAGALPADKQRIVAELKSSYGIVAMVGDGINDSQALAEADISVAMGSGSDIAMDVAQVTVAGGLLSALPKAVRLSGATVKIIRENLFWAFIYNVIGIPLAAGALYPFAGILLNPMFASAAMAASSVSVVCNSLRLKNVKVD